MEINTPTEYMLELEWEENDLIHAIEYLREWDSRSDDFYKKHKQIHKDFDSSEREHYRNCVNFWKKRLDYENTKT